MPDLKVEKTLTADEYLKKYNNSSGVGYEQYLADRKLLQSALKTKKKKVMSFADWKKANTDKLEGMDLPEKTKSYKKYLGK